MRIHVQIYEGFDATSDTPKASQLQVNTGNGQFRYCYLDTRNNGVAYQSPQNIVTYGNKSCKINIIYYQLWDSNFSRV